MKKSLLLLLTLTMILSSLVMPPLDVGAVSTAAGEVPEGYTPADGAQPISTEEEFLNMDPGGSYYLTCDITIGTTYGADYVATGETDEDGNAVYAYNHVSSSSDPAKCNYVFSGTFDGCGHNVYLSAPMFCELSGTVKNLVVKNTSVTIKLAEKFLGAVALRVAPADAKKPTTIENVRVNNNVRTTLGSSFSAAFVGGATESGINVVFKNCVNTAAVGSKLIAGGFIGGSNGSGNFFFENCVNTGHIMADGGNTKSIAAGFFGRMNKENSTVTFKNCTNIGQIDAFNNIDSGSTNVACGGILGSMSASGSTLIFENCVNEGAVLTCYRGGGIVGYLASCAEVTFTNCVNCGIVNNTDTEASSNRTAAGIAGWVEAIGTATFDGCVNRPQNCTYLFPAKYDENTTVNEKYTESSYINAVHYSGGIVGFGKGSTINISDCINSMKVNADFGDAGGIYGGTGTTGSTITITHCENSGCIEGGKFVGGIAGNFTNVVYKLYGCVNSGEVKGVGSNTKLSVSPFIGACSSSDSALQNSISIGRISLADDVSESALTAVIGVSSTSVDPTTFANVNNNLVLEGTGVDVSAYDSDMVESVSAEDVENGTVVARANTAAEKTLFHQAKGSAIISINEISVGYGNATYLDGESHVYECFCGEKVTEAHADENKDGLCDICNSVMKTRFTGAQLYLGSDLRLHFKAVLTEDDKALGVPSVNFYKNGVACEADGFTVNGEVYDFTISLTPQQMTISIDAELVVGDAVVDRREGFTIKEYCDGLLELYPENKELTDLVDAMLIYGAEAQKYVGYNQDNLASDKTATTEGKPEADPNVSIGAVKREDAVIKYAYVHFNSFLNLCFKVRLPAEGTYYVFINDKLVGSKGISTVDGVDYNVFYSENLTPAGILNSYHIVVSDTSDGSNVLHEVTYSGLEYTRVKWEDDSFGGLARALYHLAWAAQAYTSAN